MDSNEYKGILGILNDYEDFMEFWGILILRSYAQILCLFSLGKRPSFNQNSCFNNFVFPTEWQILIGPLLIKKAKLGECYQVIIWVSEGHLNGVWRMSGWCMLNVYLIGKCLRATFRSPSKHNFLPLPNLAQFWIPREVENLESFSLQDETTDSFVWVCYFAPVELSI